MKQCSCLCKGWWPFILFPLLLLIPTLFFNWHSIESDVASNAENQLANDHAWTSVETRDRGREVLLIGSASNQEAVDNAIEAAYLGEGVRTVKYEGEIAPVVVAPVVEAPVIVAPVIVQQAADYSVWFNGKGIVLKGLVSSEEDRQKLYDDAVSVHGDDQVVNNLVIVTPPQQGISTNVALVSPQIFSTSKSFNLGNIIRVADNELTVTGDVASLGIKKRVSNVLSSFFKGNIDNQLNIVLPKIEEADLVTSDNCQQLFVKLLSTQTVNFESAKAVIKQVSLPLLDQFVNTARRCPDAKFEVAGHTDSTGDDDFNMTLSQARSNVVVSHIINSGLNSNRFKVAGYGETKPIADNTTAKGRAKNRRIEFSILN